MPACELCPSMAEGMLVLCCSCGARVTSNCGEHPMAQMHYEQLAVDDTQTLDGALRHRAGPSLPLCSRPCPARLLEAC